MIIDTHLTLSYNIMTITTFMLPMELTRQMHFLYCVTGDTVEVLAK